MRGEMMAGPENHQNFGHFLSELMREKGFKSDEQLARRAMFLQEKLKPRINIQRRTINNWRNNKSRPRSVDDKQFQLVSIALEMTDDDLAKVENYLTNNDQISIDHQSDLNKTDWRMPMKASLLGTFCLVVVLAFITYIFIDQNDPRVTFTDTIPPTQLRVSDEGFVLPGSNSKTVSERELETLTGWELFVARNEIFARAGRPFVKPSSICLQNHFDSWSKSTSSQSGWYLKRSGDIKLSDLEYRNAEIIRNYECNVRGGQYNCSGQLNQCQ